MKTFVLTNQELTSTTNVIELIKSLRTECVQPEHKTCKEVRTNLRAVKSPIKS